MSAETLPRRSDPRSFDARNRASSGGKRRDIQGLRALAVGLVVVFHLVPAILPGGYIGVDVFFVISGFLITAHLVRELEATGRVRVAEFWARRVRRLLPASLLVIAVCAVATFTVMPGISRVQNFLEIAFASGYVLNWNLAASAVDYLNATNPESLVQHYWSLSVEEQFYLVWPVLLMAGVFFAARLRARGIQRGSEPGSAAVTTRRGVLVVLLVVFVASFVFSIVETARSQPSAYFITTTRAWEFALGGLVALVPSLRLPAPARALLSWIALFVIIGSALLFGPGTAFPGSIALVPVAATALLILLGDSDWTASPQRFARAGAVQSVGDLSYSIYLWHWPLIVIVAANLGDWPSWVRIPMIVAVTLVLAALTERFVERPFRRPSGAFRKRSVTFIAMFSSIAVILAVVLPAAFGIQSALAQRQDDLHDQLAAEGSAASACIGAQAVYNDCADPFAYTDLVDPAFAQGDGPWSWFDAEPAAEACSSATIGSWVERSCRFDGDPDGSQVLLLGDSHADHIASPLERIAASNGWTLRVETRQACNPFREADPADDQNATRCVEWGTEQVRGIVADPTVDVVILSTRGDSGVWTENAERAFAELQAAGKKVIVMTDTPNVDGREVRNGDLITGPACVLAAGQVDDACSWQDQRTDTWVEDTAAAAGLPVVDLRSIVCPEGTCHAVVGGLIAFSDENHLSGAYALSLTGWLEKQLVPLVRPASAG